MVMRQEIESPELWSCLEWKEIDFFKSEEYATFLFWAYPSLLGWPLRIEWLFSPVVGNALYPGDLWGIDEAGNLLLIETKRGGRSDPFEDFIKYQKDQLWKKTGCTDKLLVKWKKYYSYEMDFWNKNKTELSERKYNASFANGILPYSSKRFVTWNLSTLYVNLIAPHLFMTCSYVENIKAFLETRTRSGLEGIYYFGVVFNEEHHSDLLSAKGQLHYNELRALAGNERVILSHITAEKSPYENSVKIIVQPVATG